MIRIIVFYLIVFLIFATCNRSNVGEFTNHLATESSLYLRQHAHNPVDWHPWSDEAWEKARRENKLVLVSVGYSSCHWCHVMERESFEDTSVAKIMNEHFVCIKVDREERPDVDHVYMTAVQLMTGGGGWPLNCFTLPDGRPIYGGTYFPNSAWKDLLTKLNDFYREDGDKAEEYANELLLGIQKSELIGVRNTDTTFAKDTLEKAIEAWKPYLDNVEGGPARAPKFPLPGNYLLLMRYAEQTGDKGLLEHVNLTLTKMAYGGIYDQIAGGFARYSVDSLWKVPHFEKMLYDNSQLIALYSEAYKLFNNELYKQIATETIDFLTNEMSDGKGGYYSAIDADSEGEEGKYYVWTKEEISGLKLPRCGKAEGTLVFFDYFNVNEKGHWEHNNYILLRKQSDEEIARRHGVSDGELKDFIAKAKSILKKRRSDRIPPALDKKIITSWNALHITGLCHAYMAFGDEKLKEEAVKCANRILKDAINNDGTLVHVAHQKNKITSGYLEDYAFTISAFIDLYQVTFEERWLIQAKKFCDDAIENYYDDSDGLFWFTSKRDKGLVARKKETSDNVIPASNSEMANALFKLGDYFDDNKYSDMARRMLASTVENISHYPSSYSNWANLMMNYVFPFNEIVITGKQADEFLKTISSRYNPGCIFAGSSKNESSLPLLENRFVDGKTLIYVCTNKTCKLPVESVERAEANLIIERR